MCHGFRSRSSAEARLKMAYMIRHSLALVSIILAACTAGRTTAPEADLVLYNGKVITVDGGFSIARAIAIRGDRIVAVGDDARVRSLAGGRTRQIDLAGRTVIPGLMDGHLHNAGGGPGVALASVRTIDELRAVVEARAKARQPGEVVRAIRPRT